VLAVSEIQATGTNFHKRHWRYYIR